MLKRKDNAPNIVLIMADQLRFDYVGAYNEMPMIQTPHIDSLANDGLRCDQAYSPNPVCIPARYNMLTGLGARYHGFDDNYFGEQSKACPWHLPTFAQILSDAGYATAAIGKMHFQPTRRATGFDIFESMDEVVGDIEEDEYAQFLRANGYGHIGSLHGVRNVLYMQPQQSILPEALHGSCWVADRAIDYLKRRGDQNRPYLLFAGFIHPHPPFDVPPEWAHMYDGKIPECTVSSTPLSTLAEENKCIAENPDADTLRRMRELYACAVSHMDSQVGRILQAIDESGQRDNTLVIFVSDHGEMLGDLGTYQKFLPYDASCKIPMLLRWPAQIEPGRHTEAFTDLNDILPTMLHAAGVDYPGTLPLPGMSILHDNGNKDRKYQYVEHQRGSKRWCMLRDAKYKYVHHYGDAPELFDMLQDPNETTNLLYNCQDSDVWDIAQQYKEKLLDYETRHGLQGGVVGNDFEKRPAYIATPYQEGCFPTSMVRYAGDDPAGCLCDEILEAVRNEPTVDLSRRSVVERLVQAGQCTTEQGDSFVKMARQINRYRQENV